MYKENIINTSEFLERHRETLASLEQILSQNYNKLGLACFAGMVTTTNNGAVAEITFLTPRDSAIETCLNNPDIRIPIMEALKITQVQATRKSDQLKESLTSIPRPPHPIMKMGFDEIKEWYPQFLRHLYLTEEAPLDFKMFAKRDKITGDFIEPTPLKIYDDIAQSILPRSTWQGFSFSDENLLTKIKSVAVYILGKLNIDHETFSEHTEIKHEEVGEEQEYGENCILDGNDGELVSENYVVEHVQTDKTEGEQNRVKLST